MTSRRILLSTIAAVVVFGFGVAGPSRLEAAPEPATRLVLKNGTVYLLKEPPRISGTRVVFTTIDGQMFSLDESEIGSIGSAPAPTPGLRRYDQEDSRNLGAIARQQRDVKGKPAEVAPRAPSKKTTPKPKPKSKPTKTPKPKTTRTPPPQPTPHG